MKPFGLSCLLCLAAVSGGLWLWTRSHAGSTKPDAPPKAILSSGQKHRVTFEMAQAGLEMINTRAPAFSKRGTDGLEHSLQALADGGPLVLTFIKKGCPCSEAAQPLFNNLKTAYPDAQIYGVIDVDTVEAQRWAERFRVAYPILSDPGLDLMRSYHAESSTFVALIDPASRIVGFWPGFSKTMLRDLGQEIARLTGQSLREFDVSDAPEELYSGCPFDL